MRFKDYYRGRSVLVTGHTGFKGSWLCEWLLDLGAIVTGLALEPEGDKPIFHALRLGDRIESDLRGDVRSLKTVEAVVKQSRPEVIFHLAAQPLVRASYERPVETFEVNLIGTVNLLESIRLIDNSCTAVLVTTDKCYENREWVYSYRENDRFGGHDPYSASKACAEIAIASYAKSFFVQGDAKRLVSARAGNVIGGGDWSRDRIVPDCMRAIFDGRSIPVRNRYSTRPWQHVLEPLSGYLWLAACIGTDNANRLSDGEYATGINFGPQVQSNRTVADLVEEISKHVLAVWHDESNDSALHEAGRLNLSIDKAFHLLRWYPVWDFERTVAETVKWYTAAREVSDAAEITKSQIHAYCCDAEKSRVEWSR